jgi:hypothetical protein
MRELLAVPAVATREEKATLPLTWEQVREMQDSGLNSFETHTFHQPILAYVVEFDEVRQEPGECRRVVELHLGHAIRCLTYPVGKFEHFGHTELHIAKEVGFAWAFTTVEEVMHSIERPYLFPRLAVDVHFSWLILAAELAGLLGVLLRLRKKYERVSK